MAIAVGIGLLSIVAATVIALFALWRWLTRPSFNDGINEALWNAIAELHDTVYRLEMNVAKLEKLMEASDRGNRTLKISKRGEDW